MNSDVKAAQRSYIKFCVELGKTPIETKNMLKQTKSGSQVSRALVYRWHKRFTDDKSTQLKLNICWRQTRTDEILTSLMYITRRHTYNADLHLDVKGRTFLGSMAIYLDVLVKIFLPFLYA